jgi:formylglycine-generating enzyme required for sulfatase activity/tRNA A-37 threonylcarbamoyl transferase component Bud32
MSQPTTSPLPIGFELHEYRIERVLGHGGFGVTYLARDRHLNAQVAIKEFLPRDIATRTRKGEVKPTESKHADDYAWGLDRFKREARALARFKHPNIVRVARMLEANSTAYMVMEFEVGLTLSEYLRGPSARLSEGDLLGVFLPILDGLADLHAVDLIHRDIKPGNIYLRKNGPMLLDFGSARQVIGSGEDHALTALVTPGYAPLEQYSNDERQGPWSDVYAVGASMYMCMFGAAPIDATKRSAALSEGEPDPYQSATLRGAGQFSADVLAAVDWAMALRMRDRPQSAAELKQRLTAGAVAPTTLKIPDLSAYDEPTMRADDAAGDGLRTAVLSPTQGGRPRPWWVRSRPLAIAALAAVITLTAFAVRRVQAQRADDAAFAAAAAEHAPTAYARYLMECTRCGHRAEAEAAQDALNAEIRAAAEAEAKARADAEAAAKAKREADALAARRAARPAPRTDAGGAAAGTRALAGGATTARPHGGKGLAPGTRIHDDLGPLGPAPELVVVAGGAFQMGDLSGNGARDELPLHKVAIAPFAIGLREVTRGEFAAFVEATGYKTVAQRGGGCRVTKQGRIASDKWTNWKRGPFSQSDASPVICVTWNDARAYADWLSQTTKRRYRLPTEAEWEYAARAGTSTDFWWGEQGAAGQANCDGCGTGSRARTLESGAFPANAWGLLDVAGNVAEWTCSEYGKGYDGGERECVEVDSLRDRAVRGGAWSQPPESVRSANRSSAPADLASDSLGFRIAAEL